MKTLFYIMTLIYVSILPINDIFAQCELKLIYPNNYNAHTNMGSFNPDSVMIDTCENSQSYGKKFAKKFFILQFNPYYYPFDSILKPDCVKEVSDICNNRNDLKIIFQQLDSIFGKIYFQGLINEYPDSSLLENPRIRLFFENYQNIDYIIDYFKNSIDSLITVSYLIRLGIPMTVPNDEALRPRINLSDINLFFKKDYNPDTGLWGEFYPNNFEPFGFQSYIYELNCPMAWEITFGSQNTFIAISDIWGNSSNHPDLIQNHFFPGNAGNSISDCQPLRTDHGLAVMSNAVARNDNNAPMVGTAPRCRAISINQYENAWNFDLDGVVNHPSFILFPDVKNNSYGSPHSLALSRDDIDSGIVVVVSAGNDRNLLHGGGLFDYRLAVQMPDGRFQVRPTTVYPGASNYTDPVSPDDPTLDYKVIAVAAEKSGICNGENCLPWTGANGQKNPNYTKDIQFSDSWNFSPGINKFDISTNQNTRIAEKENAFVDLIAPARDILVAWEDGGISDCDTQHGPIGSDDWFNCKTGITKPNPITWAWLGDSRVQNAIWDARKYRLLHGTSHSAPEVSGIVGLMLSINRFCGVPLKVDLKPLIGRDVQRKVYNILTFTAKKIHDQENFSRNSWLEGSDEYYYSYQFPNGDPYQYNYVTQTNDNLKRSWAQRVGFGLVDAYRAVAHSIENKGSWTFTSSQILPFADNNTNGDIRGYQNPVGDRTTKLGDRLMLFGGYAMEGEMGIDEYRNNISGYQQIDVLQFGGASMPNEIHNNQGLTKLTNNNHYCPIKIC